MIHASLSSEELKEPTEMSDVENENNAEEDEEESDDTVIRRLMEEGDTIAYAFRCARVEGLDAYEGLLLLGELFPCFTKKSLVKVDIYVT